MKMKNIFIGLLVVIVLYQLTTMCSNSKEKVTEKVSATNTQLISHMRTEQVVKDFTITSVNVMYVSVLDDGTSRDGLAEYFCQIAKEKRSTVERVKIVKFGSQKASDRDNAYGKLLGESWCR